MLGCCLHRRVTQGFRSARVDTKVLRLAQELQRTTRTFAALMYGVDARLVFAAIKRRRVEAEAVPFITGAACVFHIWTREIGHAARHETTVNIELHLDSTGGRSLIHCPAVDVLSVGVIDSAAKERIECCEIEADGERSDKHRFNDRLCDQVARQSRQSFRRCITYSVHAQE
jgi:hypothetical protein